MTLQIFYNTKHFFSYQRRLLVKRNPPSCTWTHGLSVRNLIENVRSQGEPGWSKSLTDWFSVSPAVPISNTRLSFITESEPSCRQSPNWPQSKQLFPGYVCPGISPRWLPKLVLEASLDADWHLVPDWCQIYQHGKYITPQFPVKLQNTL